MINLLGESAEVFPGIAWMYGTSAIFVMRCDHRDYALNAF